jgi:hypothetical protein
MHMFMEDGLVGNQHLILDCTLYTCLCFKAYWVAAVLSRRILTNDYDGIFDDLVTVPINDLGKYASYEISGATVSVIAENRHKILKEWRQYSEILR